MASILSEYMPTSIKIKVDFVETMQFIADTKTGKYTTQKPDITQIVYRRLQIQEQEVNHQSDDNNDEVLLFGISS